MSVYFNKEKFIKYFISHPFTWNKTKKEIDNIFEEEFRKYDNNIFEENDNTEEYDVEVNLKNKENKNDDPFIEEGNRIGTAFIVDIKNKYGHNKVLDLSGVLNIEKAFELTKQAIKNNNYKVILEACFLYKNAVARLDAYVIDEQTIIECKSTTSTKFKYVLDVYYQQLIMSRIGYHVNKIQLALIDYVKTDKYKVNFKYTDKCNLTKAAPSLSPKYKNSYKEDEIKRLLKSGEKQFYTLKDVCSGIGEGDLYEIDINSPTLLTEKPKPKENKLIKLFEENIQSKDLDKIIEEVNQTSSENKIPEMSISDCNPLMNCPWRKEWEKFMSLKYPAFKVSGKIIELNEKMHWINTQIIDIKPKSLWRKKFLLNQDLIDNNACSEHLKQLKNKRVYYDFETISSGISTFNDSKPFEQIPFQCSMIKTTNLKKADCINLIEDPKKLDIQWMKKIVDQLYWEDASYIVYNASFEKMVLRIMDNLIDDLDYSEKIMDIIDNTWDLAKLFEPNKNGTPFIIGGLYGGYSIKFIEKHIRETGYIDKLEWKSLDYKKLEVGNGLVATNLAKKRFFNNLSDQEWERWAEALKDYCENDVVSMLMVEEFVRCKINDN